MYKNEDNKTTEASQPDVSTQDVEAIDNNDSMLKLGVLISGSGSNLQAIIDEIDKGLLNARIVKVISSRPDAYGLMRAEKAGIPNLSLNKEVYRNPASADMRIASEFLAAGADYLVMAGYMRKLGAEVLEAFPDRVLNIHPSLLPLHPGAHAIRDAFEAQSETTGVTVHFANIEYDEGPIIAQRTVEIREDDTLESLEQRIHEVEHELYPFVLKKLAAGLIQLDEKRKVHLNE